MPNRRRAREIVVQILFQQDLNPDPDVEIENEFIANRLHRKDAVVKFAKVLLNGIREKQAEIDQELQTTAENWKLNRMAATDRSILRLATFEILFFPETPGPVAINEAIELAKRYGTNNSAQFVNGILDRLLNRAKKQEIQADDACPNGVDSDPAAN